MPKSWRVAKSLAVLTDEIEAKYPGTTVWNIGDQAHQSGYSDHNPNGAGVVCASDVKPDGGLDLQKFVNHLIANPHPNLRYVIFNRKIYQRKNGFEAQAYSGKSPHTEHVHVSVGNGPDQRSTEGYDNESPWGIADLGKPKPSKPQAPSKPSTNTSNLGGKMPTLKRGSKGMDVRRLQGLLTANGYKTSIDGVFGSQTEKRVKAFQDKHAKPSDGIVGKLTWSALLGE
jgi:hypothetical protein